MRRIPLSSPLTFVGACLQAILKTIACKQAPTWFSLALVGATSALAQSVRWEPGGGQLALNQVNQIALVFENCQPIADFSIPQAEGLRIDPNPGTSENSSSVNGKMTEIFAYVFRATPERQTDIILPAFVAKTDKGEIKVAEARFSVGEARIGRTGLSMKDISSVKLTLPKDVLWAGEVVPLKFEIRIMERYSSGFSERIDWQPDPFIAEPWRAPIGNVVTVQGNEWRSLEHQTRISSKNPGKFTLKPASKLAEIFAPSFDGLQKSILNFSTKPVDITVRPLPPAPAGFAGVVGEFTLTSKVVPTTPAVGEPITWTLELSGIGNWPDLPGLPQREVSNDFQVVQPKSKRTMKDTALFEGTLSEDVVLVPTKPGQYTIGSLRFTYFNTATGSYQTITTEPVTLTVTAAAASAPAVATNGTPVQFSLTPQKTAATLPNAVPPVPPENLPREPLPENQRGFLPYLQKDLWLIATLPALTSALLVWLALAAFRSRALDPLNRRRAAHAQLTQLLERIPGSKTQDPRPSLSAWQRHASALWEIPHAAPGSALVHACVATHARDSAAAWTELWTEADRTLHGPATELPPEWTARATAALQAVKIPDWNPLSLFAGRHLFPFLSVLFVLSVLSHPSSLAAATPAELYRSADFPAAEKAWRAAVAAAPTDWSARHNLGLALAQQDRWPEALAQWSGAFLLQPNTPETRAALALGLQRSGLAPTELVSFSQDKGRHQFARHASPGEWQLILTGASLLIAAALMLLLLSGYGRIGGWAKPAALTAILVAIVLAGLASFSLRTYGQLAHPDVTLVWQAGQLRSIPTDADTQKTTPLSAGSIAIVDKTFFGWSHLTFPGGQTGWVRSEALIKLYR